MSNEFNAKNGLIIQYTQPVSGISNTTIINDDNSLVTEGQIYRELTGKTDTSVFESYTASTSGNTNNFVNVSGDTMTGTLYGTSISATTISATTLYGDGSNLTGLPQDINYYTTGTTLIGNNVYFNRNDILSAYTLNLSGFNQSNEVSGLTSNFESHTGDTSIHFQLSAITLSNIGSSAHTHSISEVNNLQQTLNGKADLSGATFTGNVIIPSLTANTINVNEYIDLTPTSGLTPTTGRLYYDSVENALSFFPNTPNMDVTLNLPQEDVRYVRNVSGAKIFNGQAVYISGNDSDLPTIDLAIASATTITDDTAFQVSGIATHDIDNNSNGFITVGGLVRNLTFTGITGHSDVYLSDTVKGGLMINKPTNNSSRVSKIGHIVKTGVGTSTIMVEINNEQASLLSSKQNEILSMNSSSTGIISGGIISIGSSTGFTISETKGYIANNSDPISPTFHIVEFSGCVNKLSNYVNNTGETYTYITIDANNNVIQTPGSVGLSPQQKRSEMLVGGILHIGGTILFAWERQINLSNPVNQIEDLTTSIGPFSITGNRISKITNTLSLTKSLGSSFYLGGNTTYYDNPNILSIGSLSASTLVYADGSKIIGPSGTTIQTSLYDPSKGVTGLIGLSNGYYAAHRIWHQPTENVLVYQYPQFEYNSYGDARANFASEDYQAPSILLNECYLVAVIITREGETNLDNTARTLIIPQGKFAGTGGGASTPDTLQTAYNNSVTPEIITDSTRGAVDFKAGSGSDLNNVITIQNTSGNITAYITGSGDISGNTFTGNGSGLTNVILAHNSTTNKQGGQSNEYFHLTSSEYSQVSGSVLSNTYNTISNFTAHTGNTSIHYELSAITLSNIGSSAHTHSISDVTNLQSNLDNKTDLTLFTGHTGDTSIHFTKSNINLSDLGNSAHTHSISEVTNLQTNLDNKLNLSGGTLTGTLYGTSISANTISATTFYGDNGNVKITGNTSFDVGITTGSGIKSSITGDDSKLSLLQSGNFTSKIEIYQSRVDVTNQLQYITPTSSNFSDRQIPDANWVSAQITGSTIGIYLPLSGGSLNGLTTFNNGLSATTISATTFYGDGSNLTGISSSGAYVPLSGGTMTGALYGTTISATTISGYTVYGSKLTNVQTTPLSSLHIIEESEASTLRGILTSQHSNGGSASRLIGRKSQGTFVTPTAITNTSGIFRFTASAHDGTNYVDDVARIEIVAAGTIGTGVIPTAINFRTSNAAGALINAMTLTPLQTLNYESDVSTGYTSRSIPDVGYINTNFINTSGDTMTGTLYGTTISATTISGGTLYGNGSNLTGLPSGGSVSGVTGQIPFFSGSSVSGTTSLTWNNTDGTLNVGDATLTHGSTTNNALNVTKNVSGYMSSDIQNINSGTSSSTDLIINSNTATETLNYLDLGINSSTYNDAAYTINGALGGYLYNLGGDLSIGTATSNKNIKFHTDGNLAANLRLTISTSASTFATPVIIPTSSATRAGLNIGAFGVAPSSPVDGDIWKSAADTLLVRMSTNSRTIPFLEKSQTFGGTQTFGTLTSTATITSRSSVLTPQTNTPAATTYTWTLTSGNRLTLTLTSSTGDVTVTTASPTAGATSELFCVGHATLSRNILLTQAGVTWVYNNIATATTVNLGTVPPDGNTFYRLIWQSATLCHVRKISSTDGTYDIAGISASTDNALVRFDGTTGKIIQNSNATLDDSGNLNINGGITGVTGTLTTLPTATSADTQIVFINPTTGVLSKGDIPSGTGVTTSRQIIANNTVGSVIGGGDLTSDRTLTLQGDSVTPGNSKYYGTNSGGTKGFYDLPSGSGSTGGTTYIAGSGITISGSVISLDIINLPYDSTPEGEDYIVYQSSGGTLERTKINDLAVTSMFRYALPEGINNSSVYFYSWAKTSTAANAVRSGNNAGMPYADACSPIVVNNSGYISEAQLVLGGAGVQAGTPVYPVVYSAEVWSVGFASEGTLRGTLTWGITSANTVGAYSVTTTNYKGSTGTINIPCTAGDLLAVKFVNGNSASSVGQMLNAFITIKYKNS